MTTLTNAVPPWSQPKKSPNEVIFFFYLYKGPPWPNLSLNKMFKIVCEFKIDWVVGAMAQWLGTCTILT